MEQLTDILKKAQGHLEKQLPFVMYCKPGEHRLSALFQNGDVSYFAEDFSEAGFIFAPFSGTEYLLIPENKSEKADADVIISNTEMPAISESEENPYARTYFEALVKKGIEAIERGQFAKVVLSRKEIVELQDSDSISIFRKLLDAYPTAFRYFWFHPETGIWMGATPERLLEAAESRFSTVALAGTQKFEGSENVTWAEKEKTEQQFVTDFISESLKNNTSELKISDPYTAKAGNLLHIKTDIQGTLHQDAALKQVIEILHPTPAVCGFPKDKAREFILANEGYDREFYSGFLGELNMPSKTDKKYTDLYVNLRCMQIKNSIANLYVGCGITKDSDPEKEYFETVNKSMTMKKVIL